jgi:hypothetical protein
MDGALGGQGGAGGVLALGEQGGAGGAGDGQVVDAEVLVALGGQLLGPALVAGGASRLAGIGCREAVAHGG